MLQKLPLNNFKWIEEYVCEFNGSFIKNYNEKNYEGYFLAVDIQYLEKLHFLPIFCLKNLETKMSKSLRRTYMIKKICYNKFETSIKS